MRKRQHKKNYKKLHEACLILKRSIEEITNRLESYLFESEKVGPEHSKCPGPYHSRQSFSPECSCEDNEKNNQKVTDEQG